jgi:hypothetical protein
MEVTGVRMVVFGAILLLSHAAVFPFETIPIPGTVLFRGVAGSQTTSTSYRRVGDIAPLASLAPFSLLPPPLSTRRHASPPSRTSYTYGLLHVSPASF